MKKLSNSTVYESARLNHGVTVIEVLTSMLVALIGVFGVLILIPFSVQQAQIGLDQDAAAVVADNAFEDLQIYGLTDVANDDGSLNLRGEVVNLDSQGRTTLSGLAPPFSTLLPEGNGSVPFGYYSSPRTALAPSLIHLDPIAFSSVGFPTAVPAPPDNIRIPVNPENPDFLTGFLPPTTGTHLPFVGFHEDSDGIDRTLNPLRMVVATGVSNTTFSPAAGLTANELLSLPEINRIFRTEDDIVTGRTNFSGGEVSDVELAQPLFDVSSQGNLVKRQVNGRISWSAVFQPIKDPTRVGRFTATPAVRYKVYILVYSDRSVIPGDEDSVMLSAPVLRHAASQDPRLFNPPQHGGYDPAVDQIVLGPDIPVDGVFRDDWVMLINRRPIAQIGGDPLTTSVMVFDPVTGGVPRQLVADEPSYATQVSFAKVISVDSEDGTVAGDSSVLNVDGGAFDFYYSDIHGGAVDLNGAPLVSDPMYTSATYVVHLRNVLNVYERTITLDIQ